MAYRRSERSIIASAAGAPDRDRGEPARPLLPPVMANRVVDGTRFVAGAITLAGLAVCWLALASWSPTDPSLSHITTAAARNLLGRPGAAIADVLLESFGLAALALLLPPLFWGLALVHCEPVPRLLRSVVACVAGVACVATALAAAPQPELWPAHHGMGGVTGEAMSRGLLALLATLQPEVVRWVVCGAAAFLGSAALTVAVGYNSPPRQRITTRPASRREKGQFQGASVPTLDGERLAPELDAGPVARHDPVPTASRKAVERFGRYADFEVEPEPIQDEFDAWTEASSGHIAARFAPSAQSPHDLQDSISQAFSVASARSSHAVGPAYAGDGSLGVMPHGSPRAEGMRGGGRIAVYKRPSLNLLERPRGKRAGPAFAASLLRGNARLLEDVLAEFGVIGHVSAITPGPVVTRYEVEPAPGTRLDRVIALADDVARGMRVASVRVAAAAGRSAFIVELPNETREAIVLRDILDADVYRSTMDVLPVALGLTTSGEPVVGDLTQMSHLLVAGGPGSGKSVGLNAMILSLIYKHGPENCRFLMIDQRMVELAKYDGIPHLLTPVVSDPHKAVTALAWCVREMEERVKRMAALGVRSIELFNNRVRNAQKRGERLARTVQTGFDDKTGTAKYEHEEMSLEPMAYIVIVIEDFADLMAVAGRELEGAVQRLAEAARMAGIHLIMASERPAAEVMTATIKSSLPTRISYKLAARRDSRAVLGADGAEQLLGAGDMLYATGPGVPTRLHGPFVSNEEVETVADCLRQQGGTQYVAALAAAPKRSLDRPAERRPADLPPSSASRVNAGGEDDLFDRAVAIVVRERMASVALLERRLAISPGWAAALMGRLEAARIIGPAGPQGYHPLIVGAAA